MKKSITIALLTFLLFAYSSQAVFPREIQYKFRHLTTKDGLPDNYISSILEDKQGFLWFGTRYGISRYDGYNFESFCLINDSAQFSQMSIRTIFEDNEGNFWVSTRKNGMKVFDKSKESFSHVDYDFYNQNSPGNNYVIDIFQDKQGTLWFGTNSNGLVRYDAKTASFESFKQDPDNPGNPRDNVNAIFEDRDGNLWVGTDNGVFAFDWEKKIFNPIPINKYLSPVVLVNSIIQDIEGNLWIGSGRGLFKYEINSKQYKFYGRTNPEIHKDKQDHLSHHTVYSIFQDPEEKENILWIATHNGLNRFDVNKEKFTWFLIDENNPNSISSNSLSCLYQDKSGLIWIGTRNSGISVLSNNLGPFHQVLMQPAGRSYKKAASCFLLDSDSTLWAGAYDYGIYQYDKDLNYFDKPGTMPFGLENFSLTNKSRVNCIIEDSNKNIWIGSRDGKLIKYNKDDDSYKLFDLGLENSLYAEGRIYSLFEDQFNILWVGTMQGLFYINLGLEGVESPKAIEDEILSKAEIINITEDQTHKLWISSSKGLYSISPDSRENNGFGLLSENLINKVPGVVQNEFVVSMYEDEYGMLWLGSSKGLYKYNCTNGLITSVDCLKSDFEGMNIDLYGDKSDNLWIFNLPQGLLRYNTLSNQVKRYDINDGLPFDNFSAFFTKHNRFYKSSDGRMFLGGDVGSEQGFLWFYPDSLRDNKTIPPVCITKFNIGNEEYPLDSSLIYQKKIILKYNQNFFSFEFSALDYTAPEKNNYAYYLEGYEDDWIYSGNRRLANYTGVPHGKYTFRVKGSNNDGYWNEEGNYVNITILPPLWEKWYAFVFYGFALLLIIFTIVQYYLKRQKLLHDLKLEQVEAEKLKELDNLKTKFYTNISHELRTPLTLIQGPTQRVLSQIKDPSYKRDLSIALKNARRLKVLVNEMLSLSKLESGKLKLEATEVDLIEFVRVNTQSFESLANQKKITLEFKSDESKLDAFIDRQKIIQALNNLLSNAIKFTGDGGKVMVEVKTAEKRPVIPGKKVKDSVKLKFVEISVSDSGMGIPPDKLEHIFERFYQVDDQLTKDREGTGIGLAITRELIRLHHGTIEVSSKPGIGTTFTSTLPLGNSHLTADEIKNTWGDEDIDNNIFPAETYESIHQDPVIDQNENLSIKERAKPILQIVEDNKDMRSFIREYFNKDYRIIESNNGEIGIKMAIEHIPDIIISDIMMPKLDGYKFCEKIKADDRTCHIPVILLTALASREKRFAGLKTGADDFITKPFDGEELLIRVNNIIDQRNKLAQYYRRAFDVIKKGEERQILSPDEIFLDKARKTIEKNISISAYSVENFASDMALSRVQLHRKLKALLDQSTTEFIRLIRLNYSIKLLEENNGSISEIAYKSGFNNPVYFSSSFKKQFGMSPSEYINWVKKNKNHFPI